MTTISVPIDSETARAFAQASAEDQRKMKLLLSLRLRELASGPAKTLTALMDEIGAKAQARGLTPDILESILHAE